jgi:hypothetical protein
LSLGGPENYDERPVINWDSREDLCSTDFGRGHLLKRKLVWRSLQDVSAVKTEKYLSECLCSRFQGKEDLLQYMELQLPEPITALYDEALRNKFAPLHGCND